ncbi:dermonecrotic toxin domain-containing protein [Pseudomonas sp. AMR01]|uniref:dermonecrotic toxin domain-containing protein n=1 Tax=Pseudomonas sp. AMR01 TaxID=3064904 RepID=UPI0035BF9530
MASVNPPYFFEEFHQPFRRKQPTPREQALGLTLNDLDWLDTLYYATDAARQDSEERTAPMVVEKLVLEMEGSATVSLAGAFLMSPSPDDHKALLFTPYGGIEVFDNRETLLSSVINRLKNETDNIDLIAFLTIEERKNFVPDSPFTLATALIAGGVFEDQQRAIGVNQQHNIQRMLDALRTTPSLSSMLDTLLGITARTYFPGLDQRDTRVYSFTASTDNDSHATDPWLASATLSETLLQYYLKHTWPAGQRRTFSNPRHVTTGFTEAERTQDQTRWESLVEETAEVLCPLLAGLLTTWWNEDTGNGESRLEFFTQVMSDVFRADLFFKQHAQIVSAAENQELLGIFLPDQAARSAWHRPLQVEKVSIHAPYQHYVELAATLMMNDGTCAYLYTQTRGLQVLTDLADLNDTLLSMLKAAGHQDELLNYLSLEERSLYIAMDAVQVSGRPVHGGVFSTLVEDIAAKQLSNLEHALRLFRRSGGAIDLEALLDCALDVRAMLDSRLLGMDTEGRWSLHPISAEHGGPSTVQAERAKQQLLALQAADAALQVERDNHPTLRRLAIHSLNQELSRRLLKIDATDVYANTYASQAQPLEERIPLQSRSMLEHFIARLANTAEPVTDVPEFGLYSERREGTATRWSNLDVRTFNAVIEQAMKPLVEHDIRTLPRQFLERHRDSMNYALMLGLRSEAQLRQLNTTLSTRHCAILDTVLRPESMTRYKRHGLEGFMPDAYGLTLKIGDDPQLRPLANCFVLTERGGTDIQRSGQAVLWTPQRGHEPFASVYALRKALEQRLAHADKRLPLLQNLPISQRPPHQVFRLGPLQRIDEHLLNNRQQSYLDYQIDGIDRWLAMPLAPRQLQDCLDSEMQRMPPSNLGRAKALAQAMIAQQALPVWLGLASPHEQMLHAELLEQYRLSAPDQRDYLHGVPSLREHVASSLQALLKNRFPDQALNPDDILIPQRVVLTGHALSLTDFALRHLPDLHADNLRPHARGATPLPPTLDGAAVEQLVRQVDIATNYRDVLTPLLTSATEDTRQRQRRFCQQLPWQLLRHAHEEKLEERLSAKAWGFIQQVFDMPDGVARKAFNEKAAMVRPLALIATPGAVPVVVPGLYLIGPQPPATGPWVLYAPYSPSSVIKEYEDEDDLIDEIYRPGPLQAWIIRQLGDPHQALYRNLLRTPAPADDTGITLASSPVTRNILPQLFADNAQQLLKMLTCQFEKDGKDQWVSITRLLREGVPMALQFFAGKLKFPLVVWRSFKLFETSADALQAQHFGLGMHKFVQGLASLASLRSELDALLPDSAPSVSAQIPTDEPDITDPLRTRMRHFEDATVALADLSRNPLNRVYTQASSNRDFVPVEGKVYPVKRLGDHWRVSLGSDPGPYIVRNPRGQWVLDLTRREPQFGPALSRPFNRFNTRRAVREVINVQAEGMDNIRALSPFMAECINEAINVATYYTVTCHRNVALFAQQPDADSRVGRFLTDMFGILNVNPGQLAKVQARIMEMLNGLTDHTLTVPNSQRFVIGRAKWAVSSNFAFVIPTDRERRIFLMDAFFNPGMHIYEPHLNTPFDVDHHARAAALIHELGHLTSLTEDIAYLDSMRPFQDLINRGTADGLRLHTALSNLRDTALSTLTPATLLFKSWDEYAQRWDDFGRYGSTQLRDRVLKLTGAKTLNDARSVFMSDPDRRIDTILANADSLTYLITYLGRVLDPGA